MHLKIANDLNKKMNMSKNDEALFKFGSVMPDNEGYVVQGLSNIGIYDISHFARHQKLDYAVYNLPDQKKFLDEYKSKINNPLVLGCFAHILADYFFNYNTFNYKYYAKNGKIIGVKVINNSIIYTDKDTIRIYKQEDFEKYSRAIYSEINADVDIRMIDNIYRECKNIKEINYTKNDVKKTIEYMNNMKYMYANKQYNQIQYHIYSEKDLEGMVQECEKYIEEKIVNV